MYEQLCRGKPALFIPASGVPLLPWVVVSGPLSNPPNPCKGAAAHLVSLGTFSTGQSCSERAQIGCQATMVLLGLSLARVPQIFWARGSGAAANLILRMGRSRSRGQEGPSCRSGGGAGSAGVAPLSAIRLGREVPVLPALPAHPEPLGQRLVPGSFA